MTDKHDLTKNTGKTEATRDAITMAGTPPTTAVSSQGTTIKKGTNAIGFLTSIEGLALSADTIDSTALDSTGGYRSFVAGFKDAGEVAISGFFNYTAHNPMFTDFGTGASNSYTIVFSDVPTAGGTSGTSWTFNAIVTGYKTGASVGNLITFEATLKVVGAPQTPVAPV